MPPTNDPPPICPRYLPLISTSTTPTTAADQVKSFCRGSRLRPPDARLYIAFQIDERQERDDQDTEFCELYEQEGGDVEQDVSVFHGWRNGVAHCSGGQSYRTRYVLLGLVGEEANARYLPERRRWVWEAWMELWVGREGGMTIRG